MWRLTFSFASFLLWRHHHCPSDRSDLRKGKTRIECRALLWFSCPRTPRLPSPLCEISKLMQSLNVLLSLGTRRGILQVSCSPWIGFEFAPALDSSELFKSPTEHPYWDRLMIQSISVLLIKHSIYSFCPCDLSAAHVTLALSCVHFRKLRYSPLPPSSTRGIKKRINVPSPGRSRSREENFPTFFNECQAQEFICRSSWKWKWRIDQRNSLKLAVDTPVGLLYFETCHSCAKPLKQGSHAPFFCLSPSCNLNSFLFKTQPVNRIAAHTMTARYNSILLGYFLFQMKSK